MKLFDPTKTPKQDEAGTIWHPDMDAVLPCEDSTFEQAVKAAKALGFEIKFVAFEDQAEDEDDAETLWDPNPPDGDGWSLVAKFNTVECDYYAAFVRPALSGQAKKGEG